jgi:hypothetical protein
MPFNAYAMRAFRLGFLRLDLGLDGRCVGRAADLDHLRGRMSWLIRFRNDLWRKRHGYKIVKDARGVKSW